MQIDDIEVINLRYEIPAGDGFSYAGGRLTGRLTSLVRVRTRDGSIGLGAAYSHPELVRIVIEDHLRPLLIGEDPRQVEELWQSMYRLTRWYGRKGVAMSALGALDTAFWDLRGQSMGKPVWQLLGGSRTEVPGYASALLWNDDVEAVAAVRAVRRAVGRRIDVIVDASMRYSLPVAERMGRVLEEEEAFWYEEPFEPEEIDAYVSLRQRVRVPIAAGENEFGLQGFRELLRAGAVDVVQPDACRAGGISECFRVGQLAAGHQARVATHTWSDAVALVANMHVVGALPNGLTVEVDRTGNPFIDELLEEPLGIRDGQFPLPDAPGLGIALDEAAVSRYLLPGDQRLPDGAYSDMTFGLDYHVPAPPYAEAPAT